MKEKWRTNEQKPNPAMRYAKRTDNNHAEIRDGLRRAGFPVLDLSACGGGVPDLSVLVDVENKRNLFLEVKDGDKPPSAQDLTEAEKEWFKFAGWNSRKVNSLEQALEAIEEFRESLK